MNSAKPSCESNWVFTKLIELAKPDLNLAGLTLKSCSFYKKQLPVT